MSTAPATHRYALRFAAMIIVGSIVGPIVWSAAGWELGLVLGWAAASMVYVVWVWLMIGRMDATSTALHARWEDPARGVAEALILLASVASLGAVAMLLFKAHSVANAEAGALAAVALGSVAFSWLMVHTLFTLRYAKQYFAGEPAAIDFNTHDEEPRYVDFAYVAFSVGMTFQISDTDLRTSKMRGIVLRHSLLSYVFGTVIVATTINLAVSLSS